MMKKLPFYCLVAASIFMAVGCSPEPADGPVDEQGALHPAASPVSPPPSQAVQPLVVPADITRPVGCPFPKGFDHWEVCYVQGNKVGYTHTQVSHVTVEGRKLVRIEGTNRLSILRFDQPTTQETKLTGRETPEGRLVDFEGVERLGQEPTVTKGRVEGDRLILETTSQGKTRTNEAPWTEWDGGLDSMTFSLAAKPMTPGETRTLRTLLPGFYQVATVTLIAREPVDTKLLSGTYRLTPIEGQVKLGKGKAFRVMMWADRQGEVLKNQVGQLEIYRTSREAALDQADMKSFDLGLASLVPVDRRIPHPHQSKQIRYRVRLEEGDPAGVFVTGMSQQVKPLGPGSAELTVRAIRPDWPKDIKKRSDDGPTLDELKPNSLVQSDDELVRAMAEEAIGDKKSAWAKAVALERYVFENIEDKNFSKAMASAAEVAKTREGDCTEHAVLLAAMARAVGLPARVAIGLVYFERDKEPRQAFGFHMWTEIYVRDRWIPMDATLGRGGIGAAHLKLAHGSLKDADTMSCFLPVIEVMGRMKVEVIEVE